MSSTYGTWMIPCHCQWLFWLPTTSAPTALIEADFLHAQSCLAGWFEDWAATQRRISHIFCSAHVQPCATPVISRFSELSELESDFVWISVAARNKTRWGNVFWTPCRPGRGICSCTIGYRQCPFATDLRFWAKFCFRPGLVWKCCSAPKNNIIDHLVSRVISYCTIIVQAISLGLPSGNQHGNGGYTIYLDIWFL